MSNFPLNTEILSDLSFSRTAVWYHYCCDLHICNGPVVSGKSYFLAAMPLLWLFQLFISIFNNDLWTLGGGGCDIHVPFRAKHFKVSYPLHLDQWWVCVNHHLLEKKKKKTNKKKVLWCWLRDERIYKYNSKSLGGSLILCVFNRVIVVNYCLVPMTSLPRVMSVLIYFEGNKEGRERRMEGKRKRGRKGGRKDGRKGEKSRSLQSRPEVRYSRLRTGDPAHSLSTVYNPLLLITERNRVLLC